MMWESACVPYRVDALERPAHSMFVLAVAKREPCILQVILSLDNGLGP